MLDHITATPKLDALLQWLDLKLDKPGNKVVIFTRFVDMIELIGARIPREAWTGYSGRMSAKKKDESLRHFQNSPECRVLISSDAGGFGLDIPQANYSINYDLPDGAGAADQRDTRIVRASSQFNWVSRNWIFMRGSIEERNWARLNQKRAVAAGFVDRKGLTAKGQVDLTVKTLTKFLKDSGINNGNS
jgi:SNF2 family DNA or RNA helicase